VTFPSWGSIRPEEDASIVKSLSDVNVEVLRKVFVKAYKEAEGKKAHPA
jgi:hypothetical protein